MIQIRNLWGGGFGHLKLEIGIYLGFGIWKLGFKLIPSRM
jgi:hypothetical protein